MSCLADTSMAALLLNMPPDCLWGARRLYWNGVLRYHDMTMIQQNVHTRPIRTALVAGLLSVTLLAPATVTAQTKLNGRLERIENALTLVYCIADNENRGLGMSE